MPEYLAPGLFIEEIDSGSKPIEGVGVNNAAFIGYAKSGDFNTPTFISNYTQFVQQFGEEENALTTALCKELNMTVADVRKKKTASRKSWSDFARETLDKAKREGKTTKSYGEFLNTYNVPQDGLPYMDGSYMAHAVRGYYDNGGGRAYIIRVARQEDITALSYRNPSTPVVEAQPVAAQLTAGPILIRAAKPGKSGNDIKATVEHVGDGGEFRLKINQGDTNESFGDGNKPLTMETIGQIKSKLVEIETVKTATATRPDAKTFTLIGGMDAPANLAVAGGSTALAGSPLSNGLASLRPDDFVGDEAQRTGMNGLIAIDDVNFICVPDLMAGLFKRDKLEDGVVEEGNGAKAPKAELLGPEELDMGALAARQQGILDAQCSLVAFCERMGDRMAILDPIPELKPLEMKTLTANTAYNCDHGQAAIYYPWIKISDPTRKGEQMMVPPSGHIAGVWVRAASERGVHKAPANEALMGAVGLAYNTTRGEQEILNPDGINCIRAFAGTGIRVWGARTLSTISNPSWKYVNVRRLFNYIEGSLDRGLQWVPFEPNDEDLWGRVRRNISAFLWTCWKEGMLFGATPDQGYYVRCDSETNPQEMIDLGRLYCEIGINPVKPAEFVIVRIGQWSSGSSISES